MNFDNPFLYNSCFYIRLNNISKKVFEQFKLISIQVLDAERNDDKMIVVENQYREGGGYEYNTSTNSLVNLKQKIIL